MLHPDAIKKFIRRERDSHSWMKKLRNKELDIALKSVGFKTSSKIPLFRNQKVAILLGIAYKAFAFWLDMGTGKTRVALELINYWRNHGELGSVLVLVPSEPALVSWENQIEEWKVKIPFLTLPNSSSKDKWKKLEEFGGGLILATYPGLVNMVSVKKKVVRKRKGGFVTVNELFLDEKLVGKLIYGSGINGLVLDESTMVGNSGSLAFELSNKISHSSKVRYELTGTPFGRDPMMLWSQLYLIDRGESLGSNIGLFRMAFFRKQRNFWGVIEYKFKKTLQSDLNKIVKHRTILYEARECIDLPPLVDKLEEVTLPREARSYYEQYVKELKRAKASLQERQNAFVRMRQVSSGFIGMLDDEDGSKIEFAFATNPKLDRLMELVSDVPSKRKFIIFHEFIYSGEMISKALTEAGINHVTLWGSTKNVREVQDSFDHDDRVRGMVLNSMKGSFALNLQTANYLFFYESPVGVIRRKQAERRPRRPGQKYTIFQYDLCSKGTVDSRILDFHKEGKDLWQAIARSGGKIV